MSTYDGSGEIITATDENFDELLLDERLTLVDYTADWCPPCLALHPHLEAFAAEHRDILAVVSVDVDHVRRPVVRHDVYCMPTLLLLDAGTPLLRLPGEIEDLATVAATARGYHRPPNVHRSVPTDRRPSPARSFEVPAGPREGISLSLLPPDGNLGQRVGVDLDQRVEVPEGWSTSLCLFPEAADLSLLASLPADAVDSLETLAPQFDGEALASVLGLTGLAMVELRDHGVADADLLRLAELPGLRVAAVEYPDPERRPDPAVVAELQRASPRLAVNNQWLHPQLRAR